MPRYDFKCEVCGKVEEHVLPVGYSREEHPMHCGEHMDKQWPKANFTVKGFNASNGYSNDPR